MAKTLILLFHPDFQNSRANRALAEAAGSRPGTDVVDMQALYPDGRIDGEVEAARLLCRAHRPAIPGAVVFNAAAAQGLAGRGADPDVLHPP